MPSLNWIGKEKIVNHNKDVPFRLLRKNKKYSLGESEYLILEGDNLEALKALMPFYYGKVKCVYIDPLPQSLKKLYFVIFYSTKSNANLNLQCVTKKRTIRYNKITEEEINKFCLSRKI